MAYRAEVIADASGKYVSNMLRFETFAEAEAYGKDLMDRWTLVIDLRVIRCDDRVNYRWHEGRACPLEGEL